jgi:hypothetical protein
MQRKCGCTTNESGARTIMLSQNWVGVSKSTHEMGSTLNRNTSNKAYIKRACDFHVAAPASNLIIIPLITHNIQAAQVAAREKRSYVGGRSRTWRTAIGLFTIQVFSDKGKKL